MEPVLDVVLFLKDVALFEALTNAQLVEVARLAERVVVPEGAVLFRRGDPSDSLDLVRSGKLRVEADGALVAHLGPGEYAGEVGVLGEIARTATVDAIAPAELLRFDAMAFVALLDSYPEIGRGLIKGLVKRLARAVLPVEVRQATSIWMLAGE
jgi:CRP-like cAMP-binding protein